MDFRYRDRNWDGQCVYIHTVGRSNIDINIHIHLHSTYIYTQYMFIHYIYTYIHTYIHTNYTYIYIYIYIYITHKHLDIHIPIYIYIITSYMQQVNDHNAEKNILERPAGCQGWSFTCHMAWHRDGMPDETSWSLMIQNSPSKYPKYPKYPKKSRCWIDGLQSWFTAQRMD